jgi:competence protein ComEA
MRYLSLGQQLILFILSLFMLLILLLRFFHHPALPPEEIYQEIVVEVLGEVRSPGIYLFQKPPTLREAIEKAGGLKEAALFDTPSSSEALETGTLLTILKESLKITPSPPLLKGGEEGLLKEKLEGLNQNAIKIKIRRMEARKLIVFSIPLDLNRVLVEDLCLIPGIGESLAREIVTYRERRKGFRSIEELKNVKGIGEKKWRGIKTFFIVRPSTP